MILSTDPTHGPTVNDLASRGLIGPPIAFTTPDGLIHIANSVWAATDWLKANGFYSGSHLIIWHLTKRESLEARTSASAFHFLNENPTIILD